MTLKTMLYGEVSTFESLESRETVVSELVDGFLKSLVYPLKLSKSLRLGVEGPNMPFNLKMFSNTSETIDLFMSKPDELTLCALYRDDAIKVILNILNYRREPDSATTITLGVGNSIISLDQREIITQYLITTIEWLMDVLNGVSGFITQDYLDYGYPTPLERAMKVTDSLPWLSKDFHKYYRGYFWGNYLGAELVSMLGPLDGVIQSAPVYCAKKIANNGVSLQLSANTDDVTPEAYKRLREYLLPILPPKMRELDLYLPYHLNKNPYLWY